jgi:hypothetical protein
MNQEVQTQDEPEEVRIRCIGRLILRFFWFMNGELRSA